MFVVFSGLGRIDRNFKHEGESNVSTTSEIFLQKQMTIKLWNRLSNNAKVTDILRPFYRNNKKEFASKMLQKMVNAGVISKETKHNNSRNPSTIYQRTLTAESLKNSNSNTAIFLSSLGIIASDLGIEIQKDENKNDDEDSGNDDEDINMTSKSGLKLSTSLESECTKDDDINDDNGNGDEDLNMPRNVGAKSSNNCSNFSSSNGDQKDNTYMIGKQLALSDGQVVTVLRVNNQARNPYYVQFAKNNLRKWLDLSNGYQIVQEKEKSGNESDVDIDKDDEKNNKNNQSRDEIE